MNRRDIAAVVLTALTALWPMAAGAQALAAPRGPEEHLATQWAQEARVVLAGEGLPRDDQYARAAILLDRALQYAPDDADLWRQRAELAAVQGEKRAHRDALRQVVRLDPSDTAAQLDLILGLVGSDQTVDARLEQVTRLLESSRGEALAPALRSRLATVAAGAAREMGQDATFAKWLAAALQLDRTNAEAASLLYALAVQQQGTAVQRGTAAAAWVRAAPFDPAPRAALIQTLLDEAAYHEAAQQFDVMVTMQSEPPSATLIHDWVLAMAAANRPHEAVQVLREFDKLRRRQVAAAAYEEAAAQGLDQPAGFEAPDLPEALNLLNLAVYRSTALLRDRAEADRSYRTLMDQLASRANAGDVEAAQDLLWVPAVFGYELDALADRLAEIDSQSPLVLRAKGWLALQRGQADRARELLEPMAGSDPFAALGAARALPDGAPAQTRALRRVSQVWPRSIPALLAARQLVESRRAVEPTEAGSVLRQVMDRYPSKIWRTESRVMPWTSFTARALVEEADYLGALPVELTLENVSGIALSLGRGGTLPTQVMLQVRPSIEGGAVGVPPVIVDLGRALRLEAGDAVKVRTRLDRTEVGALLQQAPTAEVLVQAQAVLDPRMSPTGTIATGPLGGREEVMMRRRGAAATADNLARWKAALSGVDRVATMRAVARLAQLLGAQAPVDAEGAQPAVSPEQQQDLAEALTAAYAEFDPPLQAWTVLMLPPTEPVHAALRTMFDRARRAEDAGVRLAYLSRHVADANDPVLLASLRGGDVVVRQFAEAVQAGLTAATEPAASEQPAQEAPAPDATEAQPTK